MRFLLPIGCWVLGALSIWLFWWPVRIFMFSLIPETAQYGWVGKIIITVGIAYLGGIVIPLTCLILGIVLLVRIDQ